ncbi:MAG: carotenoid biosynthesis protein [Ferroplasma sp.]|uniref:carotenoid biosynthesis protein n=1 Tax=Ferroplasma sp. TaxID=2591003 RepID=UPI002814FF38|nr:carotenoid biosynthesis protein [Ferroplasma sp.]WMT51044.1 MAG: carotenoid biosynthesis protein [Ferroplasma sp.]
MDIEWKIAYGYIIFGSIMLVIYLFTHNYELSVAAEIVFIPVYFFHSIRLKGTKYTAIFFSVSYSLSFIVEIIGVHTGIPFGKYSYSTILGPELLSVPFAIPFLWSSLLYFSSLATRGRIMIPAILLTALDISFDPRFSRHLWHWAIPGIYFGVPVTNFIGWLITSTFIYSILYFLIRDENKADINGLIFYVLLGFFQCIEDAVVGLFLPAIISSIIFASIFVSGYLTWNNKNTYSSLNFPDNK